MHGLPMTRKLPITWLSVQGERIRVKEDLKCLGITLNGPLKFDAHFNCLTPKVEGAALLGRLLSNIGGPSNKMRHLYTEMIKFMTLRVTDFGTTHHEGGSQNSKNTKKGGYSSRLLHCLT